MAHHKHDGLVSKVQPFKLSSNEDGRYIPYCDLYFHPGIVLKPEVCETRQCNHYIRLYVSKENYNK